jgi:TetR/AcrR family transcriptional regulator, transcriptional repressor for nem operon
MVRRSATEKEASRRRILDSAGALMRERGFEGVGIDAIVARAGLTPGAFYTHFASKAALFDEVVNEALDQAERYLPKLNSLLDVEQFSRLYLDDKAVRNLGTGCIIAAISTDIHRRGGKARQAAGGYIELVHSRIATVLRDGKTTTAQTDAWRIVAQLVGTLILARMLPEEQASEAIGAARDLDHLTRDAQMSSELPVRQPT